MRNGLHRNVARHIVKHYGLYYGMVAIIYVIICALIQAPSLEFILHATDKYEYMKGWARFAIVIWTLAAPPLYMVLGLMLVWAGELRPISAFRNLVAGAAVTILSHAIVYNKSYFLFAGVDDTLETKLKFYNSLYFSIVTFTTLGYGDFTPDPSYRLIAALQGIYGYIFLGTLVGMLANSDYSPRRGSKQKNAQPAGNDAEHSDDP